jgi:hypothetical protein
MEDEDDFGDFQTNEDILFSPLQVVEDKKEELVKVDVDDALSLSVKFSQEKFHKVEESEWTDDFQQSSDVNASSDCLEKNEAVPEERYDTAALGGVSDVDKKDEGSSNDSVVGDQIADADGKEEVVDQIHVGGDSEEVLSEKVLPVDEPDLKGITEAAVESPLVVKSEIENDIQVAEKLEEVEDVEKSLNNESFSQALALKAEEAEKNESVGKVSELNSQNLEGDNSTIADVQKDEIFSSPQTLNLEDAGLDEVTFTEESADDEFVVAEPFPASSKEFQIDETLAKYEASDLKQEITDSIEFQSQEILDKTDIQNSLHFAQNSVVVSEDPAAEDDFGDFADFRTSEKEHIESNDVNQHSGFEKNLDEDFGDFESPEIFSVREAFNIELCLKRIENDDKIFAKSFSNISDFDEHIDASFENLENFASKVDMGKVVSANVDRPFEWESSSTKRLLMAEIAFNSSTNAPPMSESIFEGNYSMIHRTSLINWDANKLEKLNEILNEDKESRSPSPRANAVDYEKLKTSIPPADIVVKKESYIAVQKVLEGLANSEKESPSKAQIEEFLKNIPDISFMLQFSNI